MSKDFRGPQRLTEAGEGILENKVRLHVLTARNGDGVIILREPEHHPASHIITWALWVGARLRLCSRRPYIGSCCGCSVDGKY